jgi:nucleotide-binding universal stress UspA family protein
MSETNDRAVGEKELIVVGVDGSEPSKRALRWAARQAALTSADLAAVIAWEGTAAVAPSNRSCWVLSACTACSMPRAQSL